MSSEVRDASGAGETRGDDESDGAPTREELIDRIEKLEKRSGDQARLIALLTQAVRALVDAGHEVDPDEVPRLASGFREELDEIRELAEDAKAIARVEVGEQRQQPSKKQRVKKLARDEVIRRAIDEGQGDGGQVDFDVVETQARSHGIQQLERRTVYDAFDELAEEWPDVFTVRRGTPGRGGRSTALRALAEDIPADLRRSVENGHTMSEET